MDMPSSRLPLTRRRFLGAGALFGAGITLTACDEVFPQAPQTSEALARLGGVIKGAQERQRRAGNKAMATFLGEQHTLVLQESLRQCGEDKNGNPPQECADAAHGGSSEGQLDSAYTEALQEDGPEAGHSLVAGLYAAYMTTQERAPRKPRITPQVADGFRGEGQDGQLSDLLKMSYAAIYSSGPALAQADEGARPPIETTANRLRTLRDATIEVLDELGANVPTPEAAYTSDEPGDSLFYPTLRPITVQLRRLAGMGGTAEARIFAATWCGLVSRGEAALERNPLQVTLRGEPS